MKNNILKKVVVGFSVFAFWIIVWYISALIINKEFLLPTPHSSISALFGLMKGANFYKSILFSFLRVICGVILGVVFGAFLAFLSHKITIIRRTLSPLISIIKATPVVTFITLLWITLSGNALTVFIAFLMVVPIVWQNILNGYDAIPKSLSEICDIFEFSNYKRFKVLVAPVLMNYFFPALVTAIGLAWKAEIAAEIIAYTKNSIGQHIYDARYHLLTDEVFAWVIVIVSFSICLEIITRRILRRFDYAGNKKPQ